MMHNHHRSPARALLCMSIVAALSGRVSATCYYPNGTSDALTGILPCKSTGVSMCCKLDTAVISLLKSIRVVPTASASHATTATFGEASAPIAHGKILLA